MISSRRCTRGFTATMRSEGTAQPQQFTQTDGVDERDVAEVEVERGRWFGADESSNRFRGRRRTSVVEFARHSQAVAPLFDAEGIMHSHTPVRWGETSPGGMFGIWEQDLPELDFQISASA